MLTHTAKQAYNTLTAVNPAVEFSSSVTKADSRHQRGIFLSVSRQFSMAALNGRPCACRFLGTGLLTRLVPPTLLAGGNGSVNTTKETDMTTHAISAPALSVFSFESSYQVRVIIKRNEPWFCLRDVCAVLDIQNNSQLSKQLDTKGVSKTYTPTNGGKQQLIYVNEPNLYRVIFRSNKPEARRFQDWVFNEVLPTIRRTGQYIPGQPPTSERLSHQDMANIRRTFWAVASRLGEGQAWSNALWKCLRDATGRHAPSLFYVEDLPAIEAELKRIGSILCPLREAIHNAKKTALKRVIRNREDADKVLAEIEKKFKEESEFRWIPNKIENECFNQLMSRTEAFLPVRDDLFIEG